MTSRVRRVATGLDMYSKVPVDLMEGTIRGSLLSYVALGTILLLFGLETRAYFSSRVIKDLQLDHRSTTDVPTSSSQIRVNLNVTLLDLRCEWAVIDVVSPYLGGTQQNVTTHLRKRTLDAQGVLQNYFGERDKTQLALNDETVEESLEELHENGEDAISLNAETLQYAKEENEYLFVDFYASWCSHCRDLHPTWEALAEVMLDASEKLGNRHPKEIISDQDYEEATKVQVPVMIAKVDCVHHHDVCLKEQIRAYPTLRLFVDGKPWKHGDYRGHRRVLNMVEWLYFVEMEHKEHMDESERQVHAAHQAARERLGEEQGSDEEKQWHEQILQQRRHKIMGEANWIEAEHPGCNIAGYLLLDRTPGIFNILARSSNQEFAAHMTNVSHLIHSLTIGDANVQHLIETGRGGMVPKEVQTKIAPMDGKAFITRDLHQAHHHYLKLVPTAVEGFKYGKIDVRLFQVLVNSQLALSPPDVVPVAQFTYDLSPIAVKYRSTSRHWYDYFTSVMAIVGGVFTVVGMMDSGMDRLSQFTRKRRSATAPSRKTIVTPYR